MSVEIKSDIKHRFKSRVEYIDIAKGLCILLVLMGHLLMDDNAFKSMIYSFHMPLFFIVSGIVMKGNSFKTTLSKRFYSILLPYIIWSLIFSGFSLKKISLIAYGTNESLIVASSNGMLWFLSVMFVASILGNSIIKFIKQKYYFFSGVSIIALLLSIILNLFHNKIVIKGFQLGLPLAIDVSFLAISFVLIGKFLSETFLIKIKKHKILLKFIIGILLMMVSVLGILQNNNHGYSQMATYDIGNPLFYWLVAVLASLGLIIISMVIEECFKTKLLIFKKVLILLGQNSLLIFIIHRTLVYSLKNIYQTHNNFIVFIVVWVILSVYSSIAAFVIGRVCPTLAGKYQPSVENIEKL